MGRPRSGSPCWSRSSGTRLATTTSPRCSSPATRGPADRTLTGDWPASPTRQDVRVGSHRAERKEPAAAHGHGHGHGHGSEVELEVAPLPRALLLVVLAAVAVATVVGVVLLWPDAHQADKMKGSVGFAAQGTTYPDAVVDEVLPVCPRS